MEQTIIETLALIGVATCLYLALELYNYIYNKVLYIKDYLEWRKDIQQEKARIYNLNAYRRGA